MLKKELSSEENKSPEHCLELEGWLTKKSEYK